MYCIKFKNENSSCESNDTNYFYGTQPTGWAGQRRVEIHKGFANVAVRHERSLDANGYVEMKPVKHTWTAKMYETTSGAKAAIKRYKLSGDAVVCEVTPEMSNAIAEMLKKYPE